MTCEVRDTERALLRLERALSSRWVLDSIVLNEVNGYTVLVIRRGTRPDEFVRIQGAGDSIADALEDVTRNLSQFLASSGQVSVA